MDRLAALLAREGRALTIVVYPWPDHVLRGDAASRYVTVWRDWAARHGARFVDLFPTFIGGDDPTVVIARDYIPCDVHFSAAGHRRVAEAFVAAR
jgi:lysophospholipase L1-like esterase